MLPNVQAWGRTSWPPLATGAGPSKTFHEQVAGLSVRESPHDAGGKEG